MQILNDDDDDDLFQVVTYNIPKYIKTEHNRTLIHGLMKTVQAKEKGNDMFK